jgi:hypothetical protein
MSSTYSSMLDGFQLYFLFYLRNFLFPGFLFDSFFGEGDFHIFVKLLFHILYGLLYFISLVKSNFLGYSNVCLNPL